MLNIFKDLASQTIIQLRESINKNDILAIQKIAHKTKPSIDSMGIVSLKDKIRHLENYNLDEHSESYLRILIEDVCSVLSRIIEDIELGKVE
jgi:hypothetical protein